MWREFEFFVIFRHRRCPCNNFSIHFSYVLMKTVACNEFIIRSPSSSTWLCKPSFARTPRHASSNHCLHPLLPPDRTLNQVLRTRGRSFQLSTCSYNLHKKSFVISCLLKFLTWVCSCYFCVLFFMFKFFSKRFSKFLILLLRLTFAFIFCIIISLLTTDYCDIYKSISGMHFCCCFQ